MHIFMLIKAISLAAIKMVVGAWMLFLCFGGMVWFVDAPQPYQALLWAAAGITLLVPIAMMQYEDSQRDKKF